MGQSNNLPDINDFESVKSAIKSIETPLANFDLLVDAMLRTNNILVANFIAFHLKEIKDVKVLEAIIQLIYRPEYFGKRGKLIYCCENFDCTVYFNLFIQITLEEAGESCLNAIDVIGEMKGPIEAPDLRAATGQLEDYIRNHKHVDKTPYLRKLNRYLKSLI